LYTATEAEIRTYLETRLKLGDFWYKRGENHVLKCDDCGMMWWGLMPAEVDLGKFYELLSPEDAVSKRSQGNMELYEGYARQVSIIPKLVGKPPFKVKTLDFGCGWGYWALMAKAFGMDSYGYDISKSKRVYAKSLGVKVLKQLSGRFDFINLAGILEHLPKPLETLSGLVGMLEENGVVHISVPDGRALENGFKNPDWLKPPWRSLQPIEHLNCFTHRTLISIARVAGLGYMPQPFLLSNRHGMGLMKGILSRYNQQWFGTRLYFRKK
jgi:SAM-dependent methyltransferase